MVKKVHFNDFLGVISMIHRNIHNFVFILGTNNRKLHRVFFLFFFYSLFKVDIQNYVIVISLVKYTNRIRLEPCT